MTDSGIDLKTEFEYSEEPKGFPQLEIPESAKRCPSCTYGQRGEERTYGCRWCRGLGRLTWRWRGRVVGGHVDVRVFTGIEGAGVGVGSLTMTEDDWAELKEVFAGIELFELIDED